MLGKKDKAMTEEGQETAQIPSRSGKLKRAGIGALFFLALASIFAIYLWQHHKVTTQGATISSLSKNSAKEQKLNASLKKQIGQLNQQLQTARSSKESTDTKTSIQPAQDQQPSSSLVITGTKTVPATTYVPNFTPGPGKASTYLEVDFTIYNNSNSTHYYGTEAGSIGATPVTNTYIKGVTDKGEVEESYLSQGGGNYPWNAEVAPGGSTNGLALFDATTGVTKLQWLAPDATQPTYIVLPQS